MCEGSVAEMSLTGGGPGINYSSISPVIPMWSQSNPGVLPVWSSSCSIHQLIREKGQPCTYTPHAHTLKSQHVCTYHWRNCYSLTQYALNKVRKLLKIYYPNTHTHTHTFSCTVENELLSPALCGTVLPHGQWESLMLFLWCCHTTNSNYF